MLREAGEKAGEGLRRAVGWFCYHGKMTAVLGALAVVIAVLGVVSGQKGNAGSSPGNGAGSSQTAGGASDDGISNGVDARMASSADQDAGGAPDQPQDSLAGPELEDDQIELLDGLAEALKSRDLEAGGSLLLDHEQKLDYLFYQVMKGERYLYRNGALVSELEGEGLVLTRPMSVFYGNFQDGAPEGAGVAVRGIRLDGRRCDYADGLWSGGKLNGKAETGYRYYDYEGSGDGESREMKRTGVFAEDQMDGAFTYETVNGDGETTVWDMEAEAGRIKLDEGWIHDEEKQHYYLPSRDAKHHTFVIPEGEQDEVLWKNMLLWEE